MNRGAFAGFLIPWLAGGAWAAAAEPIASSPPGPPVAAAPGRAADDDPTAAAVAFVMVHHPELMPLLDRLRTAAPAEFTTAIAELDHARVRLAKLHDWQPERHEAALTDWKLSSRIRLLLAQLATNPSAEAEQELRQLVSQRANVRIGVLRAEQDRITARLEKITAQLEAFDHDPDAAITAEFKAVRAKAGRSTPWRSPAAQAGPGTGGKPDSPQPAPDSR
jgi:hypothetical protein